MPYYTDKNDYTPKFKVGDVVTSHGRPDPRTITERKVTRNARTCDTYYRFDDGTGAYEWSIEPTTYRRTPGDWADHLAGASFYKQGATWSVEVSHADRSALFTLVTDKGRATVVARLTPDADVECIGDHSIRLEVTGEPTVFENHENLGSASVRISNALR